MTCMQLGGACDREFSAGTFGEIAELSKAHGSEMFQSGDEAHLKRKNSTPCLKTVNRSGNALANFSPRRRWSPLSPPWPSSRCAAGADLVSLLT